MYTIGRLAERARVTRDSIRFYERQGLIEPDRKTPSGYRLYSDIAVRRLNFIRHARRCGFSLAEIGKLLRLHQTAPGARGTVYRLAADKKREIDTTVAMLKAMSDALAAVLPRGTDEPAAPAMTGSGESPLLAALEVRLSGPDDGQESRFAGLADARSPEISMYR